jgi:hypothetical protein
MRKLHILAFASFTQACSFEYGLWVPKADQTFGLIFNELGVSREEIQSWNPGVDIDEIYPNTFYKIPFKKPKYSALWNRDCPPLLYLSESTCKTRDLLNSKALSTVTPKTIRTIDPTQISASTSTDTRASQTISPGSPSPISASQRLTTLITSPSDKAKSTRATASKATTVTTSKATKVTTAKATQSTLTNKTCLSPKELPGHAKEYRTRVRKAAQTWCGAFMGEGKLGAPVGSISAGISDGWGVKFDFSISWRPGCEGDDQEKRLPLGPEGPSCVSVFEQIWEACELLSIVSKIPMLTPF